MTDQYQVTVSSAGYKTLSVKVKGKGQLLLLEKNVKECLPVVVVGYVDWRTKTIRGSCTQITCCKCLDDQAIVREKIVKEKVHDMALAKVKPAYPNPVRPNSIFNLELDNQEDETLQLSITALNGKLIFLQSKKAIKGLNRFSIIADAKWSAGIYIVQLRNEEGAIVKNEKLVIQ